MTQPQKPTPTPWKAMQEPDMRGIRAESGQQIAVCTLLSLNGGWDEATANAAHIVQCVNSRDAMLAALLCAEEADRPLEDIEAEGFKVLTAHGFKPEPSGFGERNLWAQVLNFVAEKRREALKLAGAE